MEKYRELPSSLLFYFENLFKSKKFLWNIDIFRTRFWIKRLEWQSFNEYLKSKNRLFYKANFEMVEQEYKKHKRNRYDFFMKELWELAKYYYLSNYILEFKDYILWGYFSPLIQKVIKVNKEKWIRLDMSLNITKEEFLKFWDEIEKAKIFAKNANFVWENEKIRTRKKESVWFETKFALYKYIREYEEPIWDDKTKIDNMDNIQKEKWLKEMDLVVNNANKS